MHSQTCTDNVLTRTGTTTATIDSCSKHAHWSSMYCVQPFRCPEKVFGTLPNKSPAVLLFSKLNKIFFGYFDPENTILDS